MYLILLAAGVLAVLTGVVMFGSALPVENVRTSALLISGVVALVGGMGLCGLGLALRVLNRIAERLEMQPLPVPPIASVGREDPVPRPVRPSSPAPAAPAPESPRPSLLSWLGGKGAKSGKTPAEKAEPEKPAEPAEPKVDLGPLTQIPDPPREPAVVTPPAVAATVAPPVVPPPVAPSLRVPPKPVAPTVVPPPAPAAPKVAAPAPSAPANSAASTVYRSGVIDGMAYTLFMDGSIQAELPQGLVKFNTIDELQKYLLAPR